MTLKSWRGDGWRHSERQEIQMSVSVNNSGFLFGYVE